MNDTQAAMQTSSSTKRRQDDAIKTGFTNNGVDYIQFMDFVRRALDVQTYFEVGTQKGLSLAPAACNSIAVDPEFRVASNVVGKKEVCLFFQMSSDKFFQRYNPDSLLGGPIDMAFLDGMHLFEYLLRDFSNIEKHMKRNGIIFLHDCMPTDTGMISRRQIDSAGLAWTGDVWKVPAILRKYRPDLRIHYLDCPPTGLLLITNLDPDSSHLDNAYFGIVDEFSGHGDADLLEYAKTVEVTSSKTLSTLQDLARIVWI